MQANIYIAVMQKQSATGLPLAWS